MSKQRNQNTFEKLFQTEPHKEMCFFRLIEIQYFVDTASSFFGCPKEKSCKPNFAST